MDRAAVTSSLMERYLVAQLAGDRAEALRLVLEEGPAAGLSPAELQLDVIGAAQREIGRLWQQNHVSIAQEHLATAISQLVLAQLYPRLERAPRAGKVVMLACVEGEQHDMGPRIATDFLDTAGFDVRFLGANVPTDSLVAMAAAARPDLLALSATMAFHLPALRATVARVREALGPALPIVVGGLALGATPGLAPELGVHVAGGSAHDLVAVVRRLLGPAS